MATAETDRMRRNIVDAAMSLITERGWRAATLANIATAAGVSLAELHDLFGSRLAVLAGLMHQADQAMLAGTAAEDAGEAGEAGRDRLFERMMRRYEALAPYRQGLKRLARDLRGDPVTALALVPASLNSMRWALAASGLVADGVTGTLLAKGLLLVHARVMRVWLDDDSADLARTMAALDAELRRAQPMARLLLCCRPSAPATDHPAAPDADQPAVPDVDRPAQGSPA